MKAYLAVVLNRSTNETCMDPDGAYEDYAGAVYALGR